MNWRTESTHRPSPSRSGPFRRGSATGIIILLAIAILFLSRKKEPRENIGLFDFESGNLDGWTLTGENPFYGGGPVLADSMMLWLRAPEGFRGDYLLATGSPDGESADNPDGGALSPPFKISRDYLTFLLAGELHPAVRVYLEVDDHIVFEAFGNNFYDLVQRGWDVRRFRGKTARFGIEDRSPRRSLIRVDDIRLTDKPPPAPSEWVNLESRQRSPLVQPGEFRLMFSSDTAGEGIEIASSTLVRGHDNRWRLFAETVETGDDPQQSTIILATADDLTGDWAYDGVVLAPDPAAGESFVMQPFVLIHEGVYYLYYIGSGNPWTGWREVSSGSPSPSFGGRWGEQGPWRIHLATSTDGRTWTRHGPVITDKPFAFTPWVHRVGDQWMMYYAAADPPDIMGRHAIVTRTSDDLIHWSDRSVTVMQDHEFGKSPWPEQPFVQNPLVFKRGDIWYMFAGPIDDDNLSANGCLHVFASDSPLRWDITTGHGRLFAMNGSVVRDRDGGWYITHSSMDSGGVWIAPLFWADGLDDESTSMAVGE